MIPSTCWTLKVISQTGWIPFKKKSGVRADYVIGSLEKILYLFARLYSPNVIAVELLVKALNLLADRTNKVLFWPLFMNPSNQECFFPVFSFCCFAVACETRAAIFILPEFPCCITYESPQTLSFFSLESFEDSSSIRPNRTFSCQKVWRGRHWPRAKTLSSRDVCGKKCLDSTKLNSLKVLVFTKYQVDVNEDKEKIWDMWTAHSSQIFSNCC